MLASQPRLWRSYVALGDSFTEGLNDPDTEHPGAFRGWADRLASHVAGAVAQHGIVMRYANLAIRGRTIGRITGEQVDAAIALKPDLVSLVGGGNDILRPRADVDAIAAAVEESVVRLQAAGADVLLATPTDVAGAGPLLGATRGRSALYTAHLFTIAHRHGAYLINQWGADYLKDWRLWSSDRIHMTSEGHRRVALEAFAALGHTAEAVDWRTPLPPAVRASRAAELRSHAAWTRTHVVPWVHRRLTGRSSGDGLSPKRPLLDVVPLGAAVDPSADQRLDVDGDRPAPPRL